MLSGVSFGSLCMIAFVGLLVFGPTRLKSLSREMGEAIREFKYGLEDKGKSSSHDSE